MTYTPHAQIARTENIYGRLEQPKPPELEVIETYRETYRQAFGVYPAGTHYIDGLDLLVVLRRPGGRPGDPSKQAEGA